MLNPFGTKGAAAGVDALLNAAAIRGKRMPPKQEKAIRIHWNADVARVVDTVGLYMEARGREMAGQLYPQPRLRLSDGRFNVSLIVETCCAALEEALKKDSGAELDWRRYIEKSREWSRNDEERMASLQPETIATMEAIGRAALASGANPPYMFKGANVNVKAAADFALLWALDVVEEGQL